MIENKPFDKEKFLDNTALGIVIAVCVVVVVVICGTIIASAGIVQFLIGLVVILGALVFVWAVIRIIDKYCDSGYDGYYYD